MVRYNFAAKKKIPKKSRHLRWNYEISEENFQGNSPMVRYHFVVVGDRNDVILKRILTNLSEIQEGIVQIRSCSGKVTGTKFKYLFVTYDSPIAPKFLKLDGIINYVKRDERLKERKIGKLEDYVDKLYT